MLDAAAVEFCSASLRFSGLPARTRFGAVHVVTRDRIAVVLRDVDSIGAQS
jgi:hypothetical protein